ncbi:unnamed protein product [Cochlearia groenlandica]
MKLSFLNKNTSSSSSSFSYWPWPSCHHQQNPKTRSFFTIINKPININKTESHSHSFSSSNEVMEKPLEKDCIENVIRGIKVSKRLIFEHRGESNSILEESITREEKEEGFLLLSLESNDPYYDFKKSMENMVEAHALPRRDWRSFEKLLFLFLKVNVKTSHKYIFAAFFDLLLNLEAEDSKDTTLV